MLAFRRLSGALVCTKWPVSSSMLRLSTALLTRRTHTPHSGALQRAASEVASGQRVFCRHFSEAAESSVLMKVPNMGDSITEGTVAEWKKDVGTLVKEDEVICVIDTDKVSVDIHAEASGKITGHAAEVGGTVYIGGDLCTIDTSFADQLADQPADKAQPPASSSTSAQQAPPRHNTNTSSTPEQTTHNAARRYTPLIRFPDRKAGGMRGEGRPTPAPSPREAASGASSAAASTRGSKPGIDVERYSDWSDLPSNYKSKPLTEEEIMAINLGVMPHDEPWYTHVTRQKA
ncbi:unnamed protein product [Vitrella brassicaformis CCMP3155]|uniref:Lipoyl-binding domain-containing protein n=1 Tax=Vitrella brassicaformis (strain CCMP3155) TaxID=1169540 RepID=A0A0G4G5S9_VITBC|nr:unnamed protein product [Vitrella brassicaformis CCMP3155]|mmetsp:Transcript_44006/g.109736  ORF Transcript_44006/g.109736 Transcript_44006/m.109736 type:complete len:289 (-) Transcript_44006:556-1422(-)|eukprot:CEM23441.1 unnamed protein product [Vitrella brassicaformis CCMP3155]